MSDVCEGGDKLRSDMTNWGVLKAIVTVSKTSSLYCSVCEAIQGIEEELG